MLPLLGAKEPALYDAFIEASLQEFTNSPCWCRDKLQATSRVQEDGIGRGHCGGHNQLECVSLQVQMANLGLGLWRHSSADFYPGFKLQTSDCVGFKEHLLL